MAKEVSFAKPRPRPDPAALDEFVTGGAGGGEAVKQFMRPRLSLS